jgi:hypothetical protein
MPGPSALVVALIVPFVESLAGTTLPLEAVACAALSALATLSRVPFWPRPQPAPSIAATATAAAEYRIRMGLSCAGGFRINADQSAECVPQRDEASRTRRPAVSYPPITVRPLLPSRKCAADFFFSSP